MDWFWDHYCDPADRTDPRVAPLRAADLSGLPPAYIVTCEFDPLRDEGNAYAEALAAAGVPVTHVQARGHTHTSLTMVDVIPSACRCASRSAGLRSSSGRPSRPDAASTSVRIWSPGASGRRAVPYDGAGPSEGMTHDDHRITTQRLAAGDARHRGLARARRTRATRTST